VYTYVTKEAAQNPGESNYLKMLAAFRQLFPDIVFYCTKIATATQPTNETNFLSIH
jgi:hypothetical protein